MPEELDHKRSETSVKTILLTAGSLSVILALAVWFAWVGWNNVGDVTDTQVSAHGFIALGLGVVLSLILGAGLMALVFYSARHGHDDVDHEL